MSKKLMLRVITAVTSINLVASGTAIYQSNKLLERNYEEGEARMDELEGTLRGHIGLIEESLERIEKNTGESGWGKGMGERAQALYDARGRDEKKEKKDGGET